MKSEFQLAVETLAKSQEHRIVTFTFGAIGAFISFAFGGWTEAMTFLFLAMAVDYFSGIAASIKEGKGLNSAVGFWGLAKKGFMVLILILAHQADVLLDATVIMDGAIYFYIANELLSIVENYGRCGWYLPDKVKDIITVLQNKGRPQP